MRSTLQRNTVNRRRDFSQWLSSPCVCELCLEKASASGFLCDACLQDLPLSLFACSHCAEPMQQPGRCGKCQQHPPAFDYAHCSYLYQAPLSGWIKAVKDQRQAPWLQRLLWLQCQRPPPALAGVDALVLIPSSRWKRIWRGFNPAGILARGLSQQYAIPLLQQALIKTATRDQRGLSATERRRNLRHAFQPAGLNLAGQHVLIIDDVMTTGATADAAARALKKQGAAIVGIWALARTPAD